MVCNNTQRNICLMIYSVLLAGEVTYMISQCFHCINIKHGIYILYDTGKTLKSHTCINVLLDQVCIVAVSVIVELAEYVIPDLHVTVTLTPYCTSRFSTSVFFSTVIVNLRTRTTWT